MECQRNEDGNVLLWARVAKSVTEKNNSRDGEGSAAKRPYKPRAFSDIGIASKGAGIIAVWGIEVH